MTDPTPYDELLDMIAEICARWGIVLPAAESESAE